MPRFEGQPNTRGRHDLDIVVFVEGKYDVGVIQHRWGATSARTSGRRPRIRFEKPEAGGGCTAVFTYLEGVRTVGRRHVTFGLVDRDALLHRDHWDSDLFIESEDDAFRTRMPLESGVFCLLRWEIENYLLLDVARLEAVLSAQARQPAPTPTESVAQELLAVAEAMLPLVALFIQNQSTGRDRAGPAAVFDKWFFGQHLTDREVLQEELLGHEPTAEAALAEWLPQLERFSEPRGSSAQRRWCQLSRIVKGKILLRRLLAKRGLPAGENDGQTVALLLANHGPPAEIIDIFEAIEAEANRLVAGRASA